jgi:hypothetical protein
MWMLNKFTDPGTCFFGGGMVVVGQIVSGLFVGGRGGGLGGRGGLR